MASESNYSSQNRRPLLSVVTPVYFEQDILPEFYRRTVSMFEILPEMDHELIIVNDGSTDRSLEIMVELAKSDPRVKVINLSRNFGHQIAITAGLDYASGDCVAVIDSDLQDPPEVIAEMVHQWNQGFKVVYGQRRTRKGETFFKLLTARIFYRILSWLSDVKVPVDTGDFRLLDRRVVEALNSLREENRYVRGLVSWVGFKQCAVMYDRDQRTAGKTKFPFRKMLNFAFDGISSFSDKPLRISGQLGIVVVMLSILYLLWIVLGKIFHPDMLVAGWTSLTIIVLFLGGVQLLMIGVLGEYLGRVFRLSKRRPLYFVDEAINMPIKKINTHN